MLKKHGDVSQLQMWFSMHDGDGFKVGLDYLNGFI